MSEADLIGVIEFRSDQMWSLIQWWVSISFAVMVASYIGAHKLTRSLVVIVLSMYIFTSLVVALSIVGPISFVVAALEALQHLSETTELTPVGRIALSNPSGIQGYIQPLFFVTSLLFTIGFVLYCHLNVKESNK